MALLCLSSDPAGTQTRSRVCGARAGAIVKALIAEISIDVDSSAENVVVNVCDNTISVTGDVRIIRKKTGDVDGAGSETPT